MLKFTFSLLFKGEQKGINIYIPPAYWKYFDVKFIFCPPPPPRKNSSFDIKFLLQQHGFLREIFLLYERSKAFMDSDSFVLS